MESRISGRLAKAPEGFLDQAGVREVVAQARDGRRDFIRRAFAAAGAAAVAVPASRAAAAVGSGSVASRLLWTPPVR